ncbi:MAG: autotransporter-associated beta strand repeat-containing protein, partial [Candidatus Competibacteraceae bacterium]|nr:autotransporter-associated beta strand repeat-containing protein [Candidatus Competibacteraceae bacterium]
GATLALGGGLTIAEDVTTNGSATLAMSSGSTPTTLTGIVTLGSDLTVNTSNVNSNLDIAGQITGSGSLTKTGSGTLILSNSSNSLVTGDMTVSSGTLSVTDDSNLFGGTLSLGGSSKSAILAITGTGVTVDNAINLLGNTSTGSTAISVGNDATLSGYLSGSGGFSKIGAGTLTLSATNTYAGDTTVAAGTLNIATDNNLGSGALSLGAGATLGISDSTAIAKGVTLNGDASIKADGDVTLSGTISDGASSFGLTKGGAGTLTLSGANDYDGATTVFAGTLQVAGDSSVGGGGIVLADGSALGITGASDITKAITLSSGIGDIGVNSGVTATLSGVISGSGALNKTGAGTLILSGDNTYGNTTLSGGTLSIAEATDLGSGGTTLTLDGGVLAVTGAMDINKSVVINSGNGAINLSQHATLSGTISGSGNLTKTGGSQTLTLSGNNSGYTGDITVQTGYVSITDAAGLGAGTLTLADGSLHLSLTGSSTVTNSIHLAATKGGKFSSIKVDTGQDVTLDGAISVADAGQNIGKLGNGTLTLGSAANFSGGTLTLNQGALGLQASGSISSGVLVYLAGGSGSLTLHGAGTFANNLLLDKDAYLVNADDVTLTGNISVGSGTYSFTKQGAGTLTLAGSNSYTGNTTISAGTLAATGGNAIADTSVVTVESGARLALSSDETIGGLSGGGSVALNANHLTIDEVNSNTFTGVISGSGALTKTGAGTLTLSGNHTLTGATTISAGALHGEGTLAGALTVESGATFAPGGNNGAGALHTGNLSLKNGATLNIELGGTTAGAGYDQIAVTGAVDVTGATLSIQSINSFTPSASGDFTLIDNDGSDAVIGAFSGFAEGAAVTINGVTLTLSYQGGD